MMKKKAIKKVLFGGVFILILSASAFSLRNENFSARLRPGVVAAWKTSVQSGRYTFRAIPTGNFIRKVNSEATITAIKNGRACYYQDVRLMPGSYLFNVEVSAPGPAKACINIAGKNVIISGTDGWKKATLEFSTEKVVRVHLFSLGGGIVKFKNAKLSVKQLSSYPVEFNDGSKLGAIVAPTNMNAAMRFGVWELQKYIWRMTGKTPSLSGRDKNYDGRKIVLELNKNSEDTFDDSYKIEYKGENIYLTGNSLRGMLYACYDFLKQQGCGWYMPGKVGSVIPEKKQLQLPVAKNEVPSYKIRGHNINIKEFTLDGKSWTWCNIDDLHDFFLRNQINHSYFYQSSLDMGAHRGGSYIQTRGHSYQHFLSDDHPEWWSLINGRREKMHTSGMHNNLCLSNLELRSYVAKKIIEYFKKHPEANAYCLSPMDNTSWCECNECRKLDPDKGQNEWKTYGPRKRPILSMTDRVINFTNDIATQVNKVFPDKLIEVYAYGDNINPPVREKINLGVTILYAYYPDDWEVNKSLLDNESKRSLLTRMRLDGWKKQGAKKIGLYNYGNWYYPATLNPWFFMVSDQVNSLHKKWNFYKVMGEDCNSFIAAFLMHNVKARLMWNSSLDYHKEIRDICNAFYQGSAAPMVAYYEFMADLIKNGKGCSENTKDSEILNYPEYTIKNLWTAREFLDKASMTAPNEMIARRVAYAQFSHAYLIVVIAQAKGVANDFEWQCFQKSLKHIFSLAQKYQIPVIYEKERVRLKSAYLPPLIKSIIYDKIPSNWQFKTDEDNVGTKNKWYADKIGEKWGKSISIKKDWTSQYKYHGIAWYGINLKLPQNVINKIQTENAYFYFSGVDGYTDIFFNGQKIGEEKRDPSVMWNKPYAIKIPKKLLKSDSYNTLIVKVKKLEHGAGIYKPVSIVVIPEGNKEDTECLPKDIFTIPNAANILHEADGIKGWNLFNKQNMINFKAVAKQKQLSKEWQLLIEGYNGATIYYMLPTTPGKRYKVEYKEKGDSGVKAVVYSDKKKDPLATKIVTANGMGTTEDYKKKTLYFIAELPETYLGFRVCAHSKVVMKAYIDDIAVKELSSTPK